MKRFITATLGLIFTAAYFLWTLQRMFFGPFYLKGHRQVTILNDLDKREYVMLAGLGAAALAFGIFPQPLIDVINPFTPSPNGRKKGRACTSLH